MTAFTDMIADLFSNNDLAVDAVYRTAAGTLTDVRAIKRYENKSAHAFDTGAYVEGLIVQVAAAQLPAPVKGDLLALGFTTASPELSVAGFWDGAAAYKIRTVRRDRHGLLWDLDLVDDNP